MNFPGVRVYPIDGNLYLIKIYAHDAIDEAYWWVPDYSLKFVSVQVSSFCPTGTDTTCDLSLSDQGALKAQFYSYRHWNESGKNENFSEYHNFSGIVIPAGIELQLQATSSGASNIAVNCLVIDKYLEMYGYGSNMKESTVCDMIGQVFT